MPDRWIKVLSKVAKGFVIVLATLAAAVYSAPYISEQLQLNSESIRWFRIAALGMVAWGVLGRSGSEIQSWKDGTSHERFNSLWFMLLYIVGLFCGALGILVEIVSSNTAQVVQ